MRFETKARNLVNLFHLQQNSDFIDFYILPSIMIFKGELNNSQSVMQKINDFISQNNISKLIFRSSSLNEDSLNKSNAGAFLSIANIDSKNQKQIIESIQKVANSMDDDENNEILIQPMLENIEACGVIFSYDKDNLSPYFIIEYDDSGSSSSITGGTIITKNYVHFRGEELENNLILHKVISACLKLESIYNFNFLDIEFAIIKNKVYILQVRPLIIKKNIQEIPKEILQNIAKKLDSFNKSFPHLQGDRAIFGVMPDWNPAEIIGLRPKKLALTLYKELITDSIWAYQRDNYGYKNLRSHPLMHSFLGLPYIDVRVSFNSFVPKFLDEKISAKLVNYYLDTLAKNPQLHDKVEFNIVYSCYDFNISNRLKKLLDFGFNEFEIKRIEFSLLELTNKILDPKEGLYIKDLAKIETLKTRFNNIMSSDLSDIDKIYWLNEDCKRFGTLPFAGIARAAFVAMQILNSLVEINFLSIQEKWIFLNSLETISKKLSIKIYELSQNKISKDEFLNEFGHLRAGTYNILTPSYIKAFSLYFDEGTKGAPAFEPFLLSEERMKQLDLLLSLHGLKIKGKDLFSFISTCIEGREYAKFVFTKSLSKILDLLENKANNYNISLEDFAHVDYSLIIKNYSKIDEASLKNQLLENIKTNIKEYIYTKSIKLPPLITSQKDVFFYHCDIVTPNFIGQKNISASVVLESNLKDCRGKIALIESADPGYDFLFTKGIVGLITCYGGANSHMAIRCSELDIPACIGIGQENFTKLKNSKKIFINCQDNIINTLQ